MRSFVGVRRRKGPQEPLPAPSAEWPDSLHNVWYYTEGLKRNVISGDTAQARRLLREAIRIDSTYAPAYFALGTDNLAASPDEAVAMARRAWTLDTANLWYERNYGQALLMAGRYPEALERYRRLIDKDPPTPTNFRPAGRSLRTAAQSVYGARDARFGRTSIRSHPLPERHETTPADHHQPVGQSHRRDP